MQNTKLQELADKLYRDGLSKGQQEAEVLVSEAQIKAEKMIADARQEADSIRERARKDAEEIKVNAESEIRMAYRQSLHAIRQRIEQLVTVKAVEEPTREACSDAHFIQTVLQAAVQAFNPQQDTAVSLEVLLPESLQQALESYVRQAAVETFNGNVSLRFSPTLKSGFTIGPKDGGYHLSFTDQDFEQLLKNYMRPKMIDLLFGGE